MSTFEDAKTRWDGYFYPGTKTLRNLLGVEDGKRWDELEAQITTVRVATVSRSVQGPFQSLAEELKAVHRHIFQDCYEWAGEYRTVNMIKEMPRSPGVTTSFARYDEIDAHLDRQDEFLSIAPWERLSFAQTRNTLAVLHTELNLVHPFREGNGRAVRAVMDRQASLRGIVLHWEGAEQALRVASAETMRPNKQDPYLDYEPMKKLYAEIAVPKEELPEHDLSLLADNLLEGTPSVYDAMQASIIVENQDQQIDTPQGEAEQGLEA